MSEGPIQTNVRPQLRRLGLYGGSFDPVHLGHLLVATAAMEELRLDRLVFIPAGRSPFKPGLEPAPPERRAALLRQALAGRTRMEVDTLEIDRSGLRLNGQARAQQKDRCCRGRQATDVGAIDGVQGGS
jgi:nicotinate-nucleotide adenylyltransferase